MYNSVYKKRKMIYFVYFDCVLFSTLKSAQNFYLNCLLFHFFWLLLISEPRLVDGFEYLIYFGCAYIYPFLVY